MNSTCKKPKFRWLLLTVTFALACSSAIPYPTVKDAARAAGKWPDASFEQLEAGRTAYVRKCGGCHNLHVPNAFPPSRWPEVVDSHGTDLGIELKDNTGENIVRYLVITSSK